MLNEMKCALKRNALVSKVNLSNWKTRVVEIVLHLLRFVLVQEEIDDPRVLYCLRA